MVCPQCQYLIIGPYYQPCNTYMKIFIFLLLYGPQNVILKHYLLVRITFMCHVLLNLCLHLSFIVENWPILPKSWLAYFEMLEKIGSPFN